MFEGRSIDRIYIVSAQKRREMTGGIFYIDLLLVACSYILYYKRRRRIVPRNEA